MLAKHVTYTWLIYNDVVQWLIVFYRELLQVVEALEEGGAEEVGGSSAQQEPVALVVQNLK